MANLYKRGKIWWIKCKNYKNGEIVRKSTNLRTDSARDTLKANKVLSSEIIRENREKVNFKHYKNKHIASPSPKWEDWIWEYFEDCYPEKNSTRTASNVAFRNILEFMKESKIYTPAQVEPNTGLKYFNWRKKQPKFKQFKRKETTGSIHHNTAKQEAMKLKNIMKHATVAGYIEYNPLSEFNLKSKPNKEKREISAEEECIIREYLIKNEPEWMIIAFSIAMAQGLRLNETRIHLLDQIDWNTMKLSVIGKNGKRLISLINPDIAPMLEDLKSKGLTYTYPKKINPSQSFSRMFDKIGLPHLTFHCTRVTAITRAHRVGVSRSIAMKFFNHASTAVHDLYTKLDIDDTREIIEAIKSPNPIQWKKEE